MQAEEARILLGFPPNSRPHPSQVKAAYRKKVWESHPDLFPDDQKLRAESKFKSISEAYSCLESGNSIRINGLLKNPNELVDSYRWKISGQWAIVGDDLLCKMDERHDATIDSLELLCSTNYNSSSFGFTSDVKGQQYSRSGVYSRVVKTGFPRTYGSAKRGNAWLIGAPFLLIVLGTIGLGGVKANRAYNMQKQTFPSHNPFLP